MEGNRSAAVGLEASHGNQFTPTAYPRKSGSLDVTLESSSSGSSPSGSKGGTPKELLPSSVFPSARRRAARPPITQPLEPWIALWRSSYVCSVARCSNNFNTDHLKSVNCKMVRLYGTWHTVNVCFGLGRRCEDFLTI